MTEPFTELIILTTQGVQPAKWGCIHTSGCGREDTRTSNFFGVFFLSTTPPLVKAKHTETQILLQLLFFTQNGFH